MDTETNKSEPSGSETKIVTQSEGSGRTEVSASTIGMMLGLASSNELRLLDAKLDMFGQKLTNATARIEKIVTMLQGMPNGSDLERIDVQIGGMKTMIREVLTTFSSKAGDVAPKVSGASDATKRPAAKIQTNTEGEPPTDA